MNYFVFFDIFMCLGWFIVYILIIIGSIKYNSPLISPFGQAVIASFELAVFIGYFLSGAYIIDYVSLVYILWGIIEILITYIFIIKGFIKKGQLILYLFFLTALVLTMIYLIYFKEMYFFFSYFNTIIGELIWLFYIKREEYPINKYTISIFLIKFIANAVSIPVYYGKGNFFISFMSICLPIID